MEITEKENINLRKNLIEDKSGETGNKTKMKRK